MKTITIPTESCSDIPASMLEKLNVPMVPFSVNFPDRTVLDGELPIQEIYDFYESTRQIPKTCAVSPYQYSEFFNRLLEDPEVEIVHIGYSSACSCSLPERPDQPAGLRRIAHSFSRLPERFRRVRLVDAQSSGAAYAQSAMERRGAGGGSSQMGAADQDIVHSGKARFPGGRRPRQQRCSAGCFPLRIKPRIDILKGELINTKKYYGTMKKAASQMVEDFLSEEPLDRTTGADHLCQRRRPGFVGTAASARAERRFPGSAGV